MKGVAVDLLEETRLKTTELLLGVAQHVLERVQLADQDHHLLVDLGVLDELMVTVLLEALVYGLPRLARKVTPAPKSGPDG